jgi:hypothetical protein
MITLTIKHSDGQREINLGAETMKELIDIKLPQWLPKYDNDLPLLKQCRDYKTYGQTFLKTERNSGWYYDHP